MSISATTFLPFHKALIGDEEIEGVAEVLRSGWLTAGPRVNEFETQFGSYIGATHSVAVNSCTAALHLALAAIGLKENDEVIIPTMTFAATGEVVLYFKAVPVLVDSLPNSFHIDPEAIERAITPRTRAIIPVHYAGYPCDMDAIGEIAQKHGLRVIEDAAHALPSSYKGRPVGSIGDITCFSFYATKTLTTGEGGMVTTSDAALAERIRRLSLHGISKDAWKRYSAQGTWRYDILEAGYKYNFTDLQAAIGIAQLGKCDAMRNVRESIAARYDSALASLDAYETLSAPPYVGHAHHLYVLRVRPEKLRLSRDAVIDELKQRGVGTSVHFIPLHLHSLYRDYLNYKSGQFPHAEAHFERAISLPIYPGMADADVDRVIEELDTLARTNPL
jgi:dTDP-4-amino-4,6-dideoxygalactose transaminase